MKKKQLKLPAGYKLTDYIADVNNPSFPIKQLFPYYTSNNSWTVDNYGPLTIPKKDDSVQLTAG
jgi:hypothetical protein